MWACPNGRAFFCYSALAAAAEDGRCREVWCRVREDRTTAWARGSLSLIIVAAFALRLGSTLCWVNVNWPDEIFQTLEQAHRLVFGYGIVPWEFRDGTRSWLVPGALAGIMQLSRWLGAESSFRAWISVTLCALSCVPLFAIFAFARRRYGSAAALTALCLVAGWFELVYFSGKALTEVIAGHLLLWALFVEPLRRPAWWALLLGAVCALRVQLVPAVLVAMLWPAWRARPRQRFIMAAAWLAPLVFAGALDAVTWSYPFQSYIESVRVNVFEGKSRHYGVASADAYLRSELEVLSWGAWPLWTLALWGARKALPAACCTLTIVIAHSLIAHKEYRFMFPALAIIVALAAIGVADVFRRNRVLALTAVAILATVSVARGSAYSTAQTTLGIKLYPPGSLWSNNRGPLLAFERFGRDRQVCGVGLVKIPWHGTGGYSYLHRNLQIILMRRVEELPGRTRRVNALVTPPGLPEHLGAFERVQCWQGGCAYRRPGDCVPLRNYTVNEVLRRRGE